MATFSLVHGAWGLGLQWDLVRADLEARGHAVHTPDMPCEDIDAGVDEYVAAVPPCDVVVGHSLGGLTIPYVDARLQIFLCALVAGAVTNWDDVFGEGFGGGRERDELGRSYYPDPAVAAAEMQYPPEHAHLAELLRRQAPYATDPRRPEHPAYIVVLAGRRDPSGLAAPCGAGRARRRADRARRRPHADARQPA